MELFGVQNNSTNTVLTGSKVKAVTSIPRKERKLVSRSLWASLRSLATVNINVVKLSLKWNSASWVVTCVAFHPSQVSGASGSRRSWFLLRLSSFSLSTSAWYWLCLRVSFMEDIGNMSIQASLRHFRSSENLPIHLTISMFSLLARISWKISKGKHSELLWWSGVSKYSWNTWHLLLILEFLSQEVICTLLCHRQVCSSMLVHVFQLPAV